MAHAENAIWDPQTTVYGQLLGLILASNPFAIWNRRHDLFFFLFFFFVGSVSLLSWFGG